VSFAFLFDQTQESYEWALGHIKTLYNSLITTIIIRPTAIVTDCDQALRNALSVIFPDTPTLLCMWHTNKNIQQHCKAKFTTAEAYEAFFQAWLHIVRSLTSAEFKSRLTTWTTMYPGQVSEQGVVTYSMPATPDTQKGVVYITSTWLREGRKEALIQAWTNQHLHFSTTATSRLVPYFITYLLTNYLYIELKDHILY
jgi:hypothetical protein